MEIRVGHSFVTTVELPMPLGSRFPVGISGVVSRICWVHKIAVAVLEVPCDFWLEQHRRSIPPGSFLHFVLGEKTEENKRGMIAVVDASRATPSERPIVYTELPIPFVLMEVILGPSLPS